MVSHSVEGSLPVWDTTEKKDTKQNDILKFEVPLIAFR
jgi:hypothetical protein